MDMRHITRLVTTAAITGIVALTAAGMTGSANITDHATVTGGDDVFTSWEPAVNVQSLPGTHHELNTAFNDGCPTLAPDGRTLFMASNRPGGLGGQDIWMATRESPEEPWGEPLNVGEPVNSVFD